MVDLDRFEDVADASTFRATVALVLQETAALIAALLSRRAFGHAVDEPELARLLAVKHALALRIPTVV